MIKDRFLYILLFLQYFLMSLIFCINYTALSEKISLIIFIIGLAIGLYAIYLNPPYNFNISSHIKENAKLITKGVYKYIRHPMYLSVMIMTLGLILRKMDLINIILYILPVIIIYFKAIAEEKLWMQKDIKYGIYLKNTKMFIPLIF